MMFNIRFFVARVSQQMYDEISRYNFQNGTITYHPEARIVAMKPSNWSDVAISPSLTISRRIVVVTAGTTDIPVAEEAAVTLEAANVGVDRVYDAGVAGLHRILRALPVLTDEQVACIVVIAGMDGALPSVVGGLVQVPVIAIPTSIGYGASFSGISALLTMLNSCSPGVGVVNIDNGFGGAALAYKILKS
jgi:NCAIR mutase (PurE)-related protein